MVFGGWAGGGGVTNIFIIYLGGVENFFPKGLGGGGTKANIYITIAIAIDETSILVALHFSMQNINQSCDLGHAVEQRQPVTFFVYRHVCVISVT